jgi:hypothetical protein
VLEIGSKLRNKQTNRKQETTEGKWAEKKRKPTFNNETIFNAFVFDNHDRVEGRDKVEIVLGKSEWGLVELSRVPSWTRWKRVERPDRKVGALIGLGSLPSKGRLEL